MSIQSPPQGATPTNAFVEDILGEVLNLAYTTPDNIFPNPINVRHIEPGQQVTLTINMAQSANNAVLSYTLDGINYVEIGKIEKDINLTLKVPVAFGDPLNLRLNASATIIYCRVGQPV